MKSHEEVILGSEEVSTLGVESVENKNSVSDEMGVIEKDLEDEEEYSEDGSEVTEEEVVSQKSTDDWSPKMDFNNINTRDMHSKFFRDMDTDRIGYLGEKNAKIQELRDNLRDFLQEEYMDKVSDGDLDTPEVWELDKKLTEEIRAVDKNPNELTILGITEEGRYLVAYQERYLVGNYPGSGDIIVEELPFDELKNIWRVHTKYGFFNYDIKDSALKEKEMKTILKVLESDMLVISSCTWYNIGILKRSATRDLCEVKLLVRDASSKDILYGGYGMNSKVGYSECTMRIVVPVTKMGEDEKANV